jgi:hypothetical protein
MGRSLSLVATRAAAAQETGQVFLVLLTVEHADLPAPIRLTSDRVNTIVGDETYLPFPFSIQLPEEAEERPPAVRLVIDNVNREIVLALRRIYSPPTITMRVVLASSPDVTEAGPFAFTLRNADYDAMTVSGELSYEQILDEAWPCERFTPASHPGLF